jgi:hypothetical protein
MAQAKSKELTLELDDMKKQLQDLVATIAAQFRTQQTGGKVRAILELQEFKIGIGLKRISPPFPDYALKIAYNLGHDIAPEGIIFQVKGKDFEAMYKQLTKDYKTWVTRVQQYRKKRNIY